MPWSLHATEGAFQIAGSPGVSVTVYVPDLIWPLSCGGSLSASSNESE